MSPTFNDCPSLTFNPSHLPAIPCNKNCCKSRQVNDRLPRRRPTRCCPWGWWISVSVFLTAFAVVGHADTCGRTHSGEHAEVTPLPFMTRSMFSARFCPKHTQGVLHAQPAFITCFTKENVNIDPHTISTCRLAAPAVVPLRQLKVKVGRKQKERRSQTEQEQGGGGGGGDSKSKLCEVHISRRFKGKKRGGGRRGWVVR